MPSFLSTWYSENITPKTGAHWAGPNVWLGRREGTLQSAGSIIFQGCPAGKARCSRVLPHL